MKVVFRDEASDDLDRIYAWIAKDHPAIADSVINRVLDSAEYLGRFPHIGHSGAPPGTFEWIVKGLPPSQVECGCVEASDGAMI